MIKNISEFFKSFKNKVVEADELSSKYQSQIASFAESLKKDELDKKYEENFLIILGYSFRLDDISQRLYFTFQEAIYAVDLDILMKKEDSLELNSIVYILVLDEIIKEKNTSVVNEKLKQKALEFYKKIETKSAKENKKYHIYQY